MPLTPAAQRDLLDGCDESRGVENTKLEGIGARVNVCSKKATSSVESNRGRVSGRAVGETASVADQSCGGQAVSAVRYDADEREDRCMAAGCVGVGMGNAADGSGGEA